MLANPSGAADNESMTVPFTNAFSAAWPKVSMKEAKQKIKKRKRNMPVSVLFSFSR
jgi:hypothetical protein